MNDKKRFLKLLNKHVANNITAEEEKELFMDIHSGEFDPAFYEHIMVNLKRDDVPGKDMDESKILSITDQIINFEAGSPTNKVRKISYKSWAAIAATVIVFLSAGTYLLHSKTAKETIGATVWYTSQLIEKENETDSLQTVKLEDNTTITLHPGASVKYPSHFAADKREVSLIGEAFFKVSKNPLRPFYVYHENLVTHVLGTSFLIKPKSANNLVVVEVVTGRVEVYESNQTNNSRKPVNSGVVLYPNQKAVYNSGTGKFVAALVDKPLPVPTAVQAEAENIYAFNDSSVGAIIGLLEKEYEIKIDVENEDIKKCHFTGDIADQNLYKKLDAICQSIGATYEIKGMKIMIEGKGCN